MEKSSSPTYFKTVGGFMKDFYFIKLGINITETHNLDQQDVLLKLLEQKFGDKYFLLQITQFLYSDIGSIVKTIV